MKLIITLLKRAPRKVLLAVLAGAVSGGSTTTVLALINQAIWSETSPSRTFFWAFLGLVLLACCCTLLSLFLLQHLGQGEVMKLRLGLSRQILRAPLARLEELGPPRLLSVLTDDISMVSNSIALLPVIVINSVIAVGCLIYLGWLSTSLLWIFLGLFVVGTVSYQLPLVAGMRRFQKARLLEDRLFAHFRGVTEGTKELILNRERRGGFLDSLTSTADSQRKLRIGANLTFGVANAWGQMLVFMVIGGLIFFATGQLLGVERSEVSRYVVVMIFMMTPLQVVLNSLPQLGRANIAVERIETLGFSLQDHDEPEPTPVTAELQPPAWHELRLREVSYAYKPSDGGAEDGYVFRVGPVDVSIERGELVFLVGGNGSGKTSLAKILLGFYRPNSGQITLDEQVIGDGDREAYRGLFSAVFSDFFLFEELFGLADVEGFDENAKAYLAKLQLQDKVAIRDGSFSTTSLSQGQRKRLALLVAYLEDRDIYLFDEWAADQDPVFKRFFYEVLLGELKNRGKTVLVISHDDAYYPVADRILKMDQGQLAFDGSPDGYFHHQEMPEPAS